MVLWESRTLRTLYFVVFDFSPSSVPPTGSTSSPSATSTQTPDKTKTSDEEGEPLVLGPEPQ